MGSSCPCCFLLTAVTERSYFEELNQYAMHDVTNGVLIHF